MNPSSYIVPIYGCYTLHLTESNEIEPLSFILMKNVLDINKASFPPDTRILCFDIKGSLSGRQTLQNPKVLLEPIIDPKIYDKTLKDFDFFNSFQKLDITNIQSNKIIEQLKEDSKFFSRHKLIDYSLLMYIIYTPFHTVTSQAQLKHKLHESLDSLSARSDSSHGVSKKQEENLFDLAEHTDENELLIEESNFGGQDIMVLEEKADKSHTIFHIKDSTDIAALKQIEEQYPLNTLFSRVTASARSLQSEGFQSPGSAQRESLHRNRVIKKTTSPLPAIDEEQECPLVMQNDFDTEFGGVQERKSGGIQNRGSQDDLFPFPREREEGSKSTLPRMMTFGNDERPRSGKLTGAFMDPENREEQKEDKGEDLYVGGLRPSKVFNFTGTIRTDKLDRFSLCPKNPQTNVPTPLAFIPQNTQPIMQGPFQTQQIPEGNNIIKKAVDLTLHDIQDMLQVLSFFLI
jgi:hypothetical protein